MLRNRSMRSKGKNVAKMRNLLQFTRGRIFVLFLSRTPNAGRPPDIYKPDVSKSDAENAFDIYQGLSFRGTSEHKRLNFLNALVQLLDHVREPQNLGFSVEDLLYW